MPVSSAVPRDLASFESTSDAGAARLLGTVGAAVSSLSSASACGGGVGALAAAGAAVVGAAVPTHARRAVALGDEAGAVGAAFAAVGWGVGPELDGVVLADGDDLAAQIVNLSGSGQLEIPEHWPGFGPGLNGCPALNMPVWVRDGDPDGPPARALFEPLSAPMLMVCEGDAEGRLRQGNTREWVLMPGGLALGPSGSLVTLPGEWIGTSSEARRRGGQSEPRAERQTPMPPSLSPVWQAAERYQGRVRRDAQGRLLVWDYTHGDIEVFNSRRRHLGSAHPITGEIYKPPKPGRQLDD